MSNKVTGFTPSATTTSNDAGNTSSTSPQLWPEVVGNSSASALPPVLQKRVHDEGSYSEYPMKALSGLFTGVLPSKYFHQFSVECQSRRRQEQFFALERTQCLLSFFTFCLFSFPKTHVSNDHCILTYDSSTVILIWRQATYQQIC